MPQRIAIEIIAALVFVLVLALGLWRYSVISHQLDQANQDLKSALETNRQNQAALDYQTFALEKYREYSEELALANQRAAQRAAQAIKQFEALRHDDPAVANWASQPIPSSLLKSGADKN